MSTEMENPTGLTILETDKFFYDSPDSGHPACLCSRCGKAIPERENPIIRCWPTEAGDYGFDPNADGGTEFRYCWTCSEKMGIKFSNNPTEDEFFEDGF